MSGTRFDSLGGGRFCVSGVLGFDTVPGIWKQSLVELDNSAETVIDLGQVTHVDSAGLALVIEWILWARGQGRRLRLIEIPDKLLALARISETDGLLDQDA